jgi:flagellar hook protein FlgE
MGLSTVMSTALSGMNAATAMVDVAANNLANVQTRGFKAGRVRLADLPPRTVAYAGYSGSRSVQFGSGVQVVGIETDFSQGTIRVDDKLPLLALEGEGFFILEGREGGRLYTRDGQFRLDAGGRLVSVGGELVLGFGVDADGNVDRSRLGAIEIQLGTTIATPTGGTRALRSYAIGKNGRIVGHYSNGSARTLGQLRLARFANPAGLAAVGGNKYVSTAASGLPQEFDPAAGGGASVVSGASELSNVDIGRELIELTLAGNMFSANAAVFQTADEMLGALFFPWRVR